MKTEEEIKKAMQIIKDQLPTESSDKGVAMLQGQHAALDWVITAEKEEDKDE